MIAKTVGKPSGLVDFHIIINVDFVILGIAKFFKIIQDQTA